MNNIQSGADYAKLLINDIIAGEDELTNDEKLPLPLLNYWCEEIEIYADETWHEYIIGKREHFSFSEDEMNELYDKAGLRYTDDELNELVDKGVVDVLIREDGKIVYKTNEKGNQALKDHNNE